MSLKTSTTGSWSPVFDPNKTLRDLPVEEQERLVSESIKRAIQDQLDNNIDVLVDGQVRDDIVALFTSKLEGCQDRVVVKQIQHPGQPIVLGDYLYAKSLCGDRPLKAHLTGPMTLARATSVDSEKTKYQNRNDPKFIHDIARALGEEARYLVKAGATIVQIDEPALADGVDLDLAFDAMKQIIEIGEIPFPALHICKNITKILDDVLTRSPVKMVSIEGDWLKHPVLSHINREYLNKCGKQIGLGCITVRDYSIDRLTAVQNFLGLMVNRLGYDQIWAIMPNCGLRPLPHDVAIKKIQVMVKAANSL